MTDSVCIAVFVMMILTFGLGIVVGECLAIDSIAAKREAKSRKKVAFEDFSSRRNCFINSINCYYRLQCNSYRSN